MGISWQYAVAGLLFLDGLALLATDDWRWSIVYLAVMYAGVTALLTLAWSLNIAATLLVGGWMAASVLGVSQYFKGKVSDKSPLSALVLRFLVGLLVAPLAVSLMPSFAVWLPPMHNAQLWGSIVLIGLGIWHLGLRSTEPFHVVISLLTALAGFELLVAALENSLLVAGLLAVLAVALGLVGGYLILQSGEEV